MKKFIPLLLAMAVTLLEWNSFTPAHAQDTADEGKPTFYRLTPGVYVNDWPRFTVTYPKDWVEGHPMPQEIFRAVSPGGTGDVFSVVVATPPNGTLPLDKVADAVLPFFKAFGKEMTVVSDKPSQLSNGTPAREVQIQGIMNDLPFNYACLSVAHGDVWISAQVSSQSGRIGEHLKAIIYSLQYEPSKDEPVKVPPDVQELLDGLSSAWVSHDLAKVMSHYSDRYLNSGVRKGEMERAFRQTIGFITSWEFSITDFIPAGDRAYLVGFITINRLMKAMLPNVSIIKENGEWKWYGNQRDPSP